MKQMRIVMIIFLAIFLIASVAGEELEALGEKTVNAIYAKSESPKITATIALSKGTKFSAYYETVKVENWTISADGHITILCKNGKTVHTHISNVVIKVNP